MSNDIRIKIVGSLDAKLTADKIQNQLREIQGKLNLQIGIDIEEIKKVSQQFDKIKSELNKQSKGVTIIDGTQSSNEITKVEKNVHTLFSSVEQAKKHLSQLGEIKISSNFDTETGNVKSFNVEVQKTAGVVEKLKYSMNDGSNVFQLVDRREIDTSVKVAEQQAQKMHQTKVTLEKLSAKEEQDLINQMASFREQSTARRVADDKKLSENQAKAINQNHQLIEQEKEKIALFQKSFEIDANKLLQTHSKTVDADGVKKLKDDVKNLDASMPNVNKHVQEAKLGMKQFKAEASEAARSSMSVGDSLKTAMIKFPVWMLASTAFFGAIRSMQNAISQIIDIDSQMTVLRRVAGDGVEVNKVLSESVRLAGELGNLISDVNEGFIAFARQGFRGDELTMMAEYATLLGNISEMSVDESASVLTAALKGFNMEAEKGIHVVNALNEVDNNYAICKSPLY